MSFDDPHELLGKTELPRNFDPGNGMVNAMRPGPADVMEQAALSDQFPIKYNSDPLGKGNRYRGNGKTVRNHIPGAPGLY